MTPIARVTGQPGCHAASISERIICEDDDPSPDADIIDEGSSQQQR